MGEIRRQSTKGAVYITIGVLFGFVIQALIFPKILAVNQIGLIAVLISYASLFAQFASLGFNNTIIRMFPYFRDQTKKHNGFLFIAIMVVLAGTLLAVIIFFLIKSYLVEKSIQKSPLFVEYIYYIIPLFFFLLLFMILDNYNKVLYNSVRGLLLKEVGRRVFILAAILAYFFGFLNFANFVNAYLLSVALPAILLVVYLIRQNQFHLQPRIGYLNKDLAKSMASVSLFGLFTGGTNIISLHIDRIMVDDKLGLAATGIYTTVFFFGTLVKLPARSVGRISSVFIADAWKNDNRSLIQDIYSKSCLNQFIIALLLLIGIWVNIDNVFEILPAKFEAGRYVILFIGLAFLIDLLSGTSGLIVQTSRHYKVQTYLKLLLVLLLIITNLIFIPILGITGAAIATAVSKLIQHTVKYIFLRVKYKMEPYNYKFLLVLIIGIIAYLIGYSIPNFDHYIVDILIRSSIVTIIFVSLILLFKISEDIGQMVNKILHLKNKHK